MLVGARTYFAVTAAGSWVALPAVGSCRPGFTAAAAAPGWVTVGCRVPEPAPVHTCAQSLLPQIKASPDV